MNDTADTRFFEALDQVCAQIPGLDQSCREAVAKARATGDPMDRLAAREALDKQDAALKDAVFRQVHMRMATDLSAIWDALPGAPDTSRPN